MRLLAYVIAGGLSVRLGYRLGFADGAEQAVRRMAAW